MSQIQFKTVWDKKAPLQRQKTKNKTRTAVYFYSTQQFFFRKSAFKDFIIVWHCDLERQKKIQLQFLFRRNHKINNHT